MTWIVDWNGTEYDIDPGEFTGRELSDIKKRTGFTYRDLMFEALPAFDAEAIRALFWVIDRRTDPGLKFDDYDGPPIKVFIANFAGFPPLVDDVGKVLIAAIPETNGSDSSQSTSDTTPINLND